MFFVILFFNTSIFFRAVQVNCNNALYPDVYGHYREAKFTQTKHHWWWKANRVFDQLEVTRFHTGKNQKKIISFFFVTNFVFLVPGLVVFLEEDHYVSEDFLYVLEIMKKKSKELCPKCNILSLGTYLKTFNYYTYNNRKVSLQLKSLMYVPSILHCIQ